MLSITITDWTNAENDTLNTKAGSLVEKTKGNPAYVDEQPQILIVETKKGDFSTAITNAEDGGASAKTTLKKVRKELIHELKILFRMLELHVNADESFFLDAGLTVHKRPVVDRTPLADPELDYFERDILTGTARGKVKEFPKGVTQLAVEFSYDSGLIWHNGTYASGKIFKLQGLTPKTTVIVRVRYLGTHRRESNWSGTKEVFVL